MTGFLEFDIRISIGRMKVDRKADSPIAAKQMLCPRTTLSSALSRRCLPCRKVPSAVWATCGELPSTLAASPPRPVLAPHRTQPRVSDLHKDNRSTFVMTPIPFLSYLFIP